MVLTLYGYPLSTCTRRAAVILKEKNVSYKFVAIDVPKGEHKTPEYLAHQPFGQVPYLKDGDFVLYESRAIGRHVASKYAAQGTPLLPDPANFEKTALVEQAISVEQSHFNPPTSSLTWELILKECVV